MMQVKSIRRIMAGLLMLCLMLPVCALAQGQRVTIATTFAGYDAAAQAYADALESWETVSGNIADDYSAMPDEAWQAEVADMFAQGTLDILYTSPEVAQAQLAQLVSVEELLEADATLPVRNDASLAAPDGKTYAMPVR